MSCIKESDVEEEMDPTASQLLKISKTSKNNVQIDMVLRKRKNKLKTELMRQSQTLNENSS